MAKLLEKMSLSELDEEEEILAGELRSTCNPHPLNNEKRSELHESTDILYRMGRIYLRKAMITTNLDQKHNFVKAAVLLHGARVRCKDNLDDKVAERKCVIALKDMEDLLMKKFAGNLSSSLIELSSKAARILENERSEVKRRLDGLKILSGLQKDEFEQRKGQKIDEIQNLSKHCTEIYIRQMSAISSECLRVCGPQPCQFTIVGFGSLARGEVTLYSDFRHAIILEDDVLMNKGNEEILEYFRWFSVLFHVIVIGLGETAIHKIGIKTLNNSKDQLSNWFRDSFTPSAIAFERILFHSCNASRGRQKTSETDGLFCDLIQPLSQMVECLTSENAVNDGYCVWDVMCKACFVFGSKDLFSKFENSCESILARDADRTSLKRFLTEIEKDGNWPRGVEKQPNLVEVYPRNELYRYITLLIGFASKRNRITERSGFEKLVQLTEIVKCESSDSSDWALAVAIEIRMKSYESIFYTGVKYNILEYVGPKCLINCVSLIRILMQFIGIYLPCTAVYYGLAFVEGEVLWSVLQGHLRVSEDLLKIFERNGFASEYIFSSSYRHRINAAEAYFLLHREYRLTNLDLLGKIEKLVLSIKNHDKSPFLSFLLSLIRRCRGRYPKRNNTFQSMVESSIGVSLSRDLDHSDEETIGLGHVKAIQYFNNQLTKSSDVNWQKRYIVSLLKEHLRFVETREARQLFDKLLSIFQPQKVFTKEEMELLFMHQVTWLRMTYLLRKERVQINDREEDFRSDHFRDMRISNISEDKGTMKPSAFMAHCLSVVSDDNDNLVKLSFWLHLIASQLENGREEEARQSLKDLVDFYASKGVSVVGLHIWIEMMCIAALIQMTQLWLKDFIKTWKIIDDVIEISGVSLETICRRRLMIFVVASYLDLSRAADRIAEKVMLIKKVIEICRRPGNRTMFQIYYWKAIMALINVCKEDGFMEFKIEEFHKILSEAPKSVREEVIVKYHLTTLFKDFFIKTVSERKNFPTKPEASESFDLCFHPKIRSAISDCHQAPDVSLVNRFWKLAVTEERGSRLQNLSIEFLFKFLSWYIGLRFETVPNKPLIMEIAKALENLYLSDLDKEEIDLAKKLQAVCTPFGGAEKRSRISESTQILHRIGCVYLRKVAVEEGMNQKLNFIKAATLLHGARVRFQEILKDEMLERDIYDSLDKMQELLMKKRFPQESCILLEESQKYGDELEKARRKVKNRLEKLKILRKLAGKNFDEEVEEKIREVRDILKYCSEVYKQILSDIAKRCLEVCGPQPCDFAIVGLGSLAREEATLYSDFEHVIILEDGIEKLNDNYRDVLEYFRWFSVLFHVIIIGIGETLIPSIGVESLNDFCSEDKSRNWFYDSFTPSGISFDGMMPHACKIPLGRHRSTKNKHHTIELIKPVIQMAELLTDKENKINGYHLQDVLSETCFVFGSKELFAKFENLSKSVTVTRTCDTWTEMMSNEIDLTAKVELPENNYIDPKVDLYRPLSLLLGYAAREQDAPGRSGFEKASSLKNIPKCQDSKILVWAFAVACEIRLKAYASKSNNHPRITIEMLEYVGVECLENCVDAIRILMRLIETDICAPSGGNALSNLKISFSLLYSESLDAQVTPMAPRSEIPKPRFSFLGQFSVFSPAIAATHDVDEQLSIINFHFGKGPLSSLVRSRVHLMHCQYEKAVEAADSAMDDFRAIGVKANEISPYREEIIGMDHAEKIQCFNKQLTKSSNEKWQRKYFEKLFLEHLQYDEVDKARENLVKGLRLVNMGIKLTEEVIDAEFNRLANIYHPKAALKIDKDALSKTTPFYKFQTNQIDVRQRCMEQQEFISFCKTGFGNSSNIVSKSLFGKALVQNRCENLQYESRQLLKELIASWYRKITELMRFWFDWMFHALRVQFYREWWHDVIETWEMIDDVATTGKIYFIVGQHLEAMYLAVEASVECCRTPGETSKKVEIIQNAIKICRRPENTKRFREQYYLVLQAIESMGNEDGLQEMEISDLFDILKKTPQSDCEHNFAKCSIFCMLLRFVFNRLSKKKAGLEQITCKETFLRLINDTMHPFFWPLLTQLHVTFRLKGIIPVAKGDFGIGMDGYMRSKFDIAVKMFWRVIFRERKNSYTQRCSLTIFCNSILHFMVKNFHHKICMNYSKAQFSTGPEEIDWKKIHLQSFIESRFETRKKVFDKMWMKERDLFADLFKDDFGPPE